MPTHGFDLEFMHPGLQLLSVENRPTPGQTERGALICPSWTWIFGPSVDVICQISWEKNVEGTEPQTQELERAL